MEQTWAEWMTGGMDWIQASGWLGWVWFIALYTFTCIVFLPGSALTIGAGAAYGFWFGTLLVSISSMVGAVANFLTSRYLLRGWLQRKFEGNVKFHALDRAVAKDGWRIIMLSRISPILPHSVVSYACGLTRISFWQYALASWIGFVPISAAYAYAGAVVSKIARVSAGGMPSSVIQWVFYGVGVVVTVVVTVLSTQMAARALKERVETPVEAQ